MNDTNMNTGAASLSDEQIEALKAAALAATPQDIDGAQRIDRYEDGSFISCPACGGEGNVELNSDFCNYDGEALGVQFYGIGNAHKLAEDYFRMVKPATALALIERLQRAEAAATPQADAAPNVDGLPPLPAPIEIDWPELHSQALGCGVEDRNIRDRYEAAEYGWQDGVDRAAERVPEEIFTADQMREYARDAIAAGGAQEAMQMLLSKVPIPPNAITFDKGWELLDELQRVALLAASNGEKKNG